ncbi:MAG: hypothetical protein B2I18_01190 [Cuniculiplasma sp. C_DKE]|nr:MAG: hypothetical protein B2I18_01190 [Cuniculiplasma sp. C_DKE]
MLDSEKNCKIYLNQLHQEKTNLNQMLNNFIKGPPPLKATNYVNILIWSKMLIYHLKNLEKCNQQKYDVWFKKYRLEIFGKPEEEAQRLGKPDKVISYFIKERDRLEHEGKLNIAQSAKISHLNLPNDLFRYGGPKPSNAVGIFMDANGVGWMLKMPNGSNAKVYVAMPENQMKTSIIPTNLPRELSGKSIEQLLSFYVDFLNEMINDATKEFG